MNYGNLSLSLLFPYGTACMATSRGSDPQDDLPDRGPAVVHDAIGCVDPGVAGAGLDRSPDRFGLGHEPVEACDVDRAVAPAERRG